MNLAEHHANAIVGLTYSPIAHSPKGISNYHSFIAKAGCNRTPAAGAAACSYRLQLLNTAIISNALKSNYAYAKGI
jgi:hypothetical protein